ncbi:hypothetical protein IE81DRAFT_321104 [Ceraceosorus guamensis]|uniref:SGNH hydrolase-type esterase domain-containing protein n=1 Tax=Ceraceosorus guamensis TaxID=1522189 RepID=A0A316W3N6_9BASI|nr:hypothetical protein IE81DRAFT_321104 [Ceraceosorus guamensis]PWN44496.1 hypothetical protein IE81DRAFT_321104 [Ceraceosorus guamensis]
MLLPLVKPGLLFPGATVENETRCIRSRLYALHKQGFRRIVLVSNTPVQYAPEVVAYGPNATAKAQEYSEKNNAQQAVVVQALLEKFNSNLRRGEVRTTIDVFPAYELFDRVHKSGVEYGFKDTTTPCSALPSCDGYFWYDGELRA